MARVVHVEHEHAPPVAPQHDAEDGSQARVHPKWVFPMALAVAAAFVVLFAGLLIHTLRLEAASRGADAKAAQMRQELARWRAVRAGTLEAAAQRIVDRPTGRRAQEAMINDEGGPAGDRGR